MSRKNNDVFRLTNDIIFKAVYGRDDDESREALRKMLNLILDRRDDPIVWVEIRNPINYARYMTDKESILDIRCKTSHGELINIEMQVEPLRGTENRIIYYNANNLDKLLKVRDDYASMNKAISICIMAKNYLPHTENFHSIYRYINVESGEELSDISEIHFIELGKIDCHKPVGEMTELEQFGAYLLNVNREEKKEYVDEIRTHGSEVIRMSDYVLKKCTEDEILRELAEDRELYRIEREAERIRAERREAKIAESEAKIAESEAKIAESEAKIAESEAKIAEFEKNQKNFVLKMKNDGLEVSKISEYTGLSVEEIEKL